MRTIAVISLVLATACGPDPYIADLAGNWVGTAVNADGITVVANAQFKYDKETDPDRPFSGQLDLGEWIYYVNSATSDKESAQVKLVLNTEARAVTIDATVEDTTMQANYVVDLCYAQAKGQDPALCTENGTLTLTK